MAAAPVLILAGLILGHGNPAIVTQVAVQTCAMVIVTLGYAWALRGLWRAVEQGVIRTVQAGGMLVLLWGLLAVWPSPLAVPVAEAVSAALALAVARHRLGRLAQGTVPIHSSIRPLLGPSLRVGLATLLSISVWQTPVLIAALWVSVEQVSYLTGTMRLLLGLCGLLQMALQAIYPALADRYAIDPPRARVATLSLVLLAVAVAVMGTAILMACADWLAPLLLGPDFVAVGPLLRWLLPLLIPVAIVSPMLYGLIAMGHTKDIVYLQGGALVAVVPCCVLAFWALPSAWSALVLHPVIWGQAIVISVVAWRRGVIPAGFAVCFQGTAPAAAARLPVSAKVTR
jgi:O-antigen/teichoic acid export membrane protein